MVLIWSIVSQQRTTDTILIAFENTRSRTTELIQALELEDINAQPETFVSPPKWHLAHTTWFFEEFILKHQPAYQIFDPNHSFLFNSYYNTIGERVARDRRGAQTRPRLESIMQYRKHVDDAMKKTMQANLLSDHDRSMIELGLAHEQQHQELLLMEIKYILGTQYLQPKFSDEKNSTTRSSEQKALWLNVPEGIHKIGFEGAGFYFDNETPKHKVYVEAFEICSALVTNEQYLEFIKSEEYNNPLHWLDEGWAWKMNQKINHPLYWKQLDVRWYEYLLTGLSELNMKSALCHISYYEAEAFASYKGMRLPTEEEWELASASLDWGKRWEWTSSAYLPSPGYSQAPGAVGEYNGKFMVNQKVLRGGSEATPKGHSRPTYRNFFHPDMRWMYSGIRLVK